MVNFNDKRHTVVLYPSATCNLKCSYCNIHKNEALFEIDKYLEESFENDYYFKRIVKYFPHKYQLKLIETWGGEPFLHMERIHNLLRQLIEYYPYLDSFFSSTNFSFPEWNDKVFDLIKVFSEYPERKFYLQIQLSCDGPLDINDKGRGMGTTKKCLENLQIFLQRYPLEKPENVIVTFSIKPTLSVETILDLNSKEKIVEYYKFFEDNFYSKFIQVEDLRFMTALPNVAVPTPATKYIGKQFAEYCKNCLELENNAKKYFKFQEKIRPYLSLDCFQKDDDSFKHYYTRSTLCGSGGSVVGFLPNDMITVCSEGFTQMAEEYLEGLKNRNTENTTIILNNKSNKRYLCLNDDEYCLYENRIEYFNNENQATIANIALFVKSLAYSNQIEDKYKKDKQALWAARYIFKIGYCIKDNYNMTGSITTIPIGTIKLLCNGALEYLC